MPEDVNLAVSVTGKNITELMIKADEVLHSIYLRLKRNKLELTTEKTTVTTLNNKRKIEAIKFKFGKDTIVSSKNTTYVDIILDRSLNFGKHIKVACEKTRKTAKTLCIILPNI